MPAMQNEGLANRDDGRYGGNDGTDAHAAGAVTFFLEDKRPK
jgi:hypothetical protein